MLNCPHSAEACSVLRIPHPPDLDGPVSKEADHVSNHNYPYQLIRQSDNQKKGFFRYAFHKDWDDPTLYDLCINPDKIGSERAAQLIMEMARSSELKSCSIYALDALERLSQKKRIEATLIEMDLRHSGLSVEMPEKGIAHITGVLYNHMDKGRIPTVVGRIPGVERVQVDVTLVPAGYD
ncbi:MAG: hypothetical protein EHM37_13200 [Deltaproteobacteria bacterium]|nr:MAG: hypothetical protein EHM37_13200 [Deltaproteobacteria bacterium]